MKTLTNDTDNVRRSQYSTNTLLLKTTNCSLKQQAQIYCKNIQHEQQLKACGLADSGQTDGGYTDSGLPESSQMDSGYTDSGSKDAAKGNVAYRNPAKRNGIEAPT